MLREKTKWDVALEAVQGLQKEHTKLKDERERALALLADIHAYLEGNDKMKADAQDVIMEDGKKHDMPTILEEIGNALQEMNK